MYDDIELLQEEPDHDTPGVRVSAPVLVSIVVHVFLVLFLIQAYHPIRSDDKPAPIARYVELIKQNPKEFTEAPGPKLDKAPLNAPYSDANRKASAPKPTGDQPTIRPGDGHTLYTPPAPAPSSVRSPRSSVDLRRGCNRGPRTEERGMPRNKRSVHLLP